MSHQNFNIDTINILNTKNLKLKNPKITLQTFELNPMIRMIRTLANIATVRHHYSCTHSKRSYLL